jgi:predicted RNase H-like nuclease
MRTRDLEPPGTTPTDELTVTGVDGCPRGWVAVTLSPNPATTTDARAAPMTVAVTVAATLQDLPLAAVTGIDMPIGLLAAGWRDADRLARRALGRRGASVFAIPPRQVLEAATYAEANQACRELTGQGLSVQAYGLRRKIAEADQFRCRAATPSEAPASEGTAPAAVRLYEVHPELSFATMSGAPLADSKHTQAGLAVRRQLLRQAGLILPAKVTGLAENDLLDAAAVAWSALRIAAGQAAILTSPAQRADDGSEIAIRF